ncbi:beta strand repeat-containing protein, partial [Flagellimonas oceanensis]|uniref:beta strand repeat-containing protein n=1 Tax=Flagellimonas oceanensis TaxID=2499163 RepID=UPI0013DF82B5
MTYGQVGVGTQTPNESAQLDVVAGDKGVLIPRVQLTGKNDSTTISNGNIESLLVFNTATTSDLAPGYYYWHNNTWNRISIEGEGGSGNIETGSGSPNDGSDDPIAPTDGQIYIDTGTGDTYVYDESTDSWGIVASNVVSPDINNLIVEDANGLAYLSVEAIIAAGVDTNTTNSTFSIVGTDLVIEDSEGNTVSAPLADIAAGVDTDNQTVTDFSIVGTDLSITLESGNTAVVPLADIAAGVDTNTTNSSFSIVGTDLVIEDSEGNTVSAPLADIAAGVDTNTTNSTFSIVGTDLVIEDSDGNTVSAPLADIAAGVDTDNQTLTDFSIVGTDLSIALERGNTAVVPLADIAAGVDTNTTNSTFSIVGTDLVMEDSDNNTVSVPLADIAGGVDTDNQTVTDFSIVGTDLSITLESGNTAVVPLADIAAGVDTDDQDLSLSGVNLNITDGTGVDLTQRITLPMLAATTNPNTGIFWDGTQWLYERRVKSVNNNAPDSDGNIAIPIGNVYTGPTTTTSDIDVNEIGGTPNEGDIYIVNSSAADPTQVGRTYIYDNDTTSWVEIDPFNAALYDPRYVNISGDTMTGNLDMGSNLITSLGIPINANDAANKSYVDGFAVVDLITGNKVATITEPDGTIHEINETLTTFALNADGHTLEYKDEGGTIHTVDLEVADVDNQTVTDFSIVGTDLSITLESGNTAVVPLADIAAGVDTNTTNSTFSIVGTDLVIEDSEGNTVSAPLADIAAGVDTNTTNSTFSIVGTDLVIEDSEGN